jgi:hypothetical protein
MYRLRKDYGHLLKASGPETQALRIAPRGSPRLTFTLLGDFACFFVSLQCYESRVTEVVIEGPFKKLMQAPAEIETRDSACPKSHRGEAYQRRFFFRPLYDGAAWSPEQRSPTSIEEEPGYQP